MQLGVIGAGPWGRNIITTVRSLDDVTLAAVATSNPATSTLVEQGCTIYRDWQAMLNGTELDGVIVATPPPLHFEMARQAVLGGIAVLVEKPLTMDLEQAEALQGIVQQSGGLVMVDHTHLFHPAYRKLKALCGTFGPIRAIRASGGNYGPFRPETRVLWDWGPHDLAMCIDLLGGPPDKVAVTRAERRETEEGLGENLELELWFPGDVRAEIRIGNLLQRKTRYFAVSTPEEFLVYDDQAANCLTVYQLAERGREESPGQPIPLPDELPLTNVIKAFAQAIRQGFDVGDSLNLGVQVVETLSRCQRELLA